MTVNRGLRLALLCTLSFSAHSYELETHAKITAAAYNASQIDQSALDALGISAWNLRNPPRPFAILRPDPLPSIDAYLELNTNDESVSIRLGRPYEQLRILRVSEPDKAYEIEGWLMRGAIREDDGAGIVARWKSEPKDDNPYGEINRFCNHFYDPEKTHGAAGRGFEGCMSFPLFEATVNDAAQWGLGVADPLNPSSPLIANRRNHFSVLDAREAMWRALTLRTGPGQPAPGAGYSGENLRKLYWSTTFRALGDVLHLVQDMAQPQHTRNEGHGFGTRAVYEDYINARARRLRSYVIDGLKLQSSQGELNDLNYVGGAVPAFSRFSDYWSTRSTPPRAVQQGLADYSNKGFYTLNNNVSESAYPLPSIVPSQQNTIRAPLPSYPGVSTNYVMGTVPDVVLGPSAPITMSTQSITSGLVEGGPQGLPEEVKYTLTKQNFDDRADLLIPRAVAYSAGVLDYFFRGRLQIGVPDEGVYSIVDQHKQSTPGLQGFKKLKIKVANLTAPILPSGSPPGTGAEVQAMTAGKMVAVVKFHRNTCYTPDLTHEYKDPDGNESYLCRGDEEEIVVSDPEEVTNIPPLAFGGNFDAVGTDIAFTFTSAIPINATDLFLQVVYRGTLGSESDAVVVATKDITEPTYFSVVNITDYVFCYASHYYYRRANGDYNSASLPYPPAAPGETIAPLPSEEPATVLPHAYGAYRLAFEPNSASTPIATAIVGRNQYAQVAVLTDFDRKVSRGIDGETFSLTPTPFLPGRNQVDPLSSSAFHPETLRNLRTHYPLFAARNGDGGSCAGIPIGTAGHRHPFGPEPSFVTEPDTLAREMVGATISAPFNTP